MDALEELLKEWNDFISFKQRETGLTTEYQIIKLRQKYLVTLKDKKQKDEK